MERFSPVLLYPWSPSTSPCFLPVRGLGRRMRSTPLATMPLPPRPEAKRFVAKTHSFTDVIGCRSTGRESLSEGSCDPSPKRRLGVCRACPDCLEGHSNWPTHGFINCETLKQRGGQARQWAALPWPARVRKACVRARISSVVFCQRSLRISMVEPRRIELLTPCVQGRCSPS